MKFTKSLLATAALVASFSVSAGAQVTPSLGGQFPLFLSLSGAATNCTPLTCTLGGIATISGGSIYGANNLPNNAIPAGTIDFYLSAGPAASSPSTITFDGGGVSSISFLWGSPDNYNGLKAISTGGVETSFTAGSFGLTLGGNQAYAKYVTLTAASGTYINELVFSSSSNAFEVSNFSIPVDGFVVPEPASFGLAAVGMLGLFGVARRRRNSSV